MANEQTKEPKKVTNLVDLFTVISGLEKLNMAYTTEAVPQNESEDRHYIVHIK